MKKKQSLFKQFYENLRHPKKAGLYRFQRIGHNISYAFFLTFISALLFSPSVIHATIKAGQSFSYIFLPFGLIYYYIVLTFLFFTYLSLLSLLTFALSKGIKRRVNGQQAWSLTANASTWPTLLFAVVNLFYKLPSPALFFYIIITLIFLINMILAIPKSKPRPLNATKTEKKASH